MRWRMRQQRDRCDVTDAPCDRILSANNTFFSLSERDRARQSVTVDEEITILWINSDWRDLRR